MRFASVLRDVARGGLAGILAGVVVGGIGGRLVMLVIARINPDAAGLITEADARIGEFTVPGTLALLLFGGLGTGLAGSVIWVVASPWLPWRGLQRRLAAAVMAVALVSFALVQSTNVDFELVGPTWLALALLFALVAVAGAATAWFDERLNARLPRPSERPARLVAAYGAIALLGVPALLLTVEALFDEGFSRGPMPPGVGWALVIVGMATLVSWVRRIATGKEAAPGSLVVVGRLGLAVAVALGALHVVAEIARIYATV